MSSTATPFTPHAPVPNGLPTRGQESTEAFIRETQRRRKVQEKVVSLQGSALSSPIKRSLGPVRKMRTSITNMPYDIIHIICRDITDLYPVLPTDCARGQAVNSHTGQMELLTELNSHKFADILYHLNADAAHRDMSSLGFACKTLHGHVAAAMKNLAKTDTARHAIRFEQIWFEDLSCMMFSLNGYACSNLSTINLYWDNIRRPMWTLCPPEHLQPSAAGRTFRDIRNKCRSLKMLTVRLSLSRLCAFQPDGEWLVPAAQRHHSNFKNIDGMHDLRSLVQSVRSRAGAIAVVDFAGTDREVKPAVKQQVLRWLT